MPNNNYLENVNIVQDDNRTDPLIAGVYFKENKIEVVFPRGIKIDRSNEKEIRHSTLILIRTLMFFKKRKESSTILNNRSNSKKGTEQNNLPIESILWLLSDFQSNGFYSTQTFDFVDGKYGDISWKDTIKKHIPIKSKESFLYHEYVIKNHKKYSTIISSVQKYAIYESLSLLGWLYPNLPKVDPHPLPYSTQKCVSILKQEFRNNNNDRVKKLILSLIDFLLGYSGIENSKVLIESLNTSNFEYVWEDIIYFLLNNVDLQNYLPKAQWHIKNQSNTSSSLRPDTIYQLLDTLHIIDAKYYDYGSTHLLSDLPKTSDIIKQIAYDDYISKLTLKNVSSYFILPASHIEYFYIFGEASFSNDDNKVIKGVFANTEKLMLAYISKDKKLIEQLFTELFDF